ncbi:MAG: hypothetical protein J0I43_02030 [Microbacterium sp.]|uniref:hypothetical protein n=1 Tax=Microbacterium sp. TaxID=51671 RepID=UPI001AC0F62B|nr:hypothetical protein [Microbacterium sp.]MBN9176137.1 hypothetical protein [Microbacterium sp.]
MASLAAPLGAVSSYAWDHLDMAKRERSREVAEALAALGDTKYYDRISNELLEILIAYGPPMREPKFKGNHEEYLLAVNAYLRIAQTQEAKDRAAALAAYFGFTEEPSPSGG